MQLTPSQLIKANELQQEYFTLTQHISEIKKIIHQLLQDKCDLKVTFQLHNHDQQQINEAAKKEKYFASPFDFVYEELLDAHIRVHDGRKKEKNPTNSNTLFTATESTGIRILHAILLEKEDHRHLVQSQIEAILIPSMKIELQHIINNPIHDLHT